MSNLTPSGKVKDSFKQLACYAFIGIVSNVVGYLIYFLATYLGATPKLTMTLLYAVGAAIGYIGNRNFTFTHNQSKLGSGVRYFIVHLLGYIINLVILITFVDLFGYPHEWVQAVSIFIVAGFLFLTFKFFVFTNPNVLNMDRL
jgi:putative flippase GtrA